MPKPPIFGWTQMGNKLVSADKRFAITRSGRGFNLIDLDTYNEYEKPTLAEAKMKAFDLKFARKQG
jgi:hypothetical protein